MDTAALPSQEAQRGSPRGIREPQAWSLALGAEAQRVTGPPSPPPRGLIDRGQSVLVYCISQQGAGDAGLPNTQVRLVMPTG